MSVVRFSWRRFGWVSDRVYFAIQPAGWRVLNPWAWRAARNMAAVLAYDTARIDAELRAMIATALETGEWPGEFKISAETLN